MATFIGAGQSYGDGEQLIHIIHLDSAKAKPWNKSRWNEIKRVIGDLSKVLSCIPRQDRDGEISITVPSQLSPKEHKAVLDSVVEALSSLGLHTGKVTQPQLRI